LTVFSCYFEGNTAGEVGGAIGLELATIAITLSSFVANQAAVLGAALHIDQPHKVKILETTFDPFVEGALVVFIGGRLGGCAQHRCDTGHSCSYDEYSLHCAPCPQHQMSVQGLQCESCPAGRGPNRNQSGCVDCGGNAFSAFGVCGMCAGRASLDHTACLECPLNMVADPPELGCRCERGYYDAAVAGPMLCYDRTTPFNSLYPPVAEDDRDGWASRQSLAQPIESENDYCQECPPDCVDCLYSGYAGQPRLNEGYATTDGPGWFERGTRVAFECPIKKSACLGENLTQVGNATTACEGGYEGVLCTTCIQTHSMESSECAECEDWTRLQIIAAVLLVLALVVAVFYIRRKLRNHHNVDEETETAFLLHEIFNELLPNLVGDFKVFIGLYQVLCSMGATLEITYPPAVESMISAVRSVANVRSPAPHACCVTSAVRLMFLNITGACSLTCSRFRACRACWTRPWLASSGCRRCCRLQSSSFAGPASSSKSAVANERL
jgi:hypothetical protein